MDELIRLIADLATITRFVIFAAKTLRKKLSKKS